MQDHSLAGIIKQFAYYKALGERTFAQLSDEELFLEPAPGVNSVAVIVKHLWGNMLSRWTDFLSSDGEKEWRDREAEFDNDIADRAELLNKWEAGWNCLFDAIMPLSIDDMTRIVYIRNQGHTVEEAIYRQLAHYAYHIGQIVQLGKWMKKEEWTSLSIPRGGSVEYNRDKFSRGKHGGHFTDDQLKKHE